MLVNTGDGLRLQVLYDLILHQLDQLDDDGDLFGPQAVNSQRCGEKQTKYEDVIISFFFGHVCLSFSKNSWLDCPRLCKRDSKAS